MTNTIITEKGLTFNKLEKEIYRMCLEWGRYILKSILEQLDKKLKNERDKARYRHKGYKKQQQYMGPVCRSVYYKINTLLKWHIHLLDETYN